MKRLMQTGLVASVVTTMFSGLIGGVADVSARGDMETYVSPTYGVTMEYDAATWSIFQENDGSDGDRVDFLGLESDEIRGGFMIQIYDTQTDADVCLVDLVELGLETAEEYELREDDDGEPIEGSSSGYAYAAYTFLSEGIYLGSYFGCQEFGDDLGMIAFWLMVNSRDFDAGLELIEPIMESVDDSDAHPAGEAGSDDDGDEDDREDGDEDEDAGEDDREDLEHDLDRGDEEDDDDRDESDGDGASQVAESGVYESPMYGFSVPVNSDNWELESIDSEGGAEAADFVGPRQQLLRIMALTADGSPLHAYTDYFVESIEQQHDLELRPYINPETGDTIEHQSRNEVYTLYTYEDGGNTYLFYLHAVPSDDGEYVVIVTGVGLTTSYDLFEEDIFGLLDQIEF